MATRGAIAASDPQTAQAGAQMLEQGGNAVDAVVAAAMASFVVEPPLTSPAGGGAMILGSAERGWEVVDMMAEVPGRGGHRTDALDFFGAEVDFGPTSQVFHIGRASAAVPGLLRGLLQIHGQAGQLPLAEVVAPAVRFARDGFVLSGPIQWVHSLLEPIVTHSEGVRRITCLGDTLAPAGATLHNGPLGDFLEGLGADSDGAQRAFEASLLAHFGTAAGGLITQADLDHWQPTIRPALLVPFDGHEVLLNPPPASGGGLVAAALRVFERLDPPRDGWLRGDHLRALAEAMSVISEMRLAGYDEAVRHGFDPLSWLGDEAVDRWKRGAAAQREERQLGHTTHISVADETGLAVGLTTSNGEGSGYVLPDLGIHVNNFLGEEDINPGGFHTQPPGQRMPTMMAPTLVLRDGHPVLVLGSGGSNRIRGAVLQGIVNHIWYGQDLDRAVNAPRLHVEGDHLWFEEWGLGPRHAQELAADWPGHTRFAKPNMFFGGVHAVCRKGAEWIGAGDRRRGGTAAQVKGST